MFCFQSLDEHSHMTFVLNNLKEILDLLAQPGEYCHSQVSAVTARWVLSQPAECCRSDKLAMVKFRWLQHKFDLFFFVKSACL